MALSMTVTTPQGFKADGAYHRVESVQIINKETMQFNLRSYKAVDTSFFDEMYFNAPYDLNGGNPIQQAYEYLKTLPKFEDAKDC